LAEISKKNKELAVVFDVDMGYSLRGFGDLGEWIWEGQPSNRRLFGDLCEWIWGRRTGWALLALS